MEKKEKETNEFMCGYCKTRIEIIETPNLVHYAKRECPKCKKFFGWVPTPNPEGIRKRTSCHEVKKVLNFHKKEKEFCFFCLRTKEQLGVNETITRDHIEELDKGGRDEVENLQILCSACHKLINWARLYINWHLKE